MDFTLVDAYLLGGGATKADALEALLRERSPDPAAAPFYRALDAIGLRAADEALIALRLVLAGQPASDDRIRRLRALCAVARAAQAGDQDELESVRKRHSGALGDIPAQNVAAAASAARAAYARELAAASAR